jgi:hypothetical protein
MQTVTMEGVCLVGTRTRHYNAFTTNDGRKVEAGKTCFVYVVDPNALGEPTAIKVPETVFDDLRSKGFGTMLNVEATAYAKNNKVEWNANHVVDQETGETLRAVS